MLTSKTRLPSVASRTAVAQAMEVLSTPPLPVKKRKRRRLVEKVHGPFSPFSSSGCQNSNHLAIGACRVQKFGPAGQLRSVGIATGQARLHHQPESREVPLWPERSKNALTVAFSAKASGCWARLNRSTCAPLCLAQFTSAAAPALRLLNYLRPTPQTPVLQHSAGSKI